MFFFLLRVLAGWVRTLMENSINFFFFLKPSLSCYSLFSKKWRATKYCARWSWRKSSKLVQKSREIRKRRIYAKIVALPYISYGLSDSVAHRLIPLEIRNLKNCLRFQDFKILWYGDFTSCWQTKHSHNLLYLEDKGFIFYLQAWFQKKNKSYFGLNVEIPLFRLPPFSGGQGGRRYEARMHLNKQWLNSLFLSK